MTHILDEGRRDGTLPGVGDTHATAIALLNATYQYHHPDLVATSGPAQAQLSALTHIIALIMAGLKRPL
ncbi:hypothetical protein [Sodalis glossinidius]|uniref:hypothetical protein n=1 Tax=Sodalis glossinidius TaxID=63612 RepID=UPI00032657E6|nr:hypothetical protein [Sodalis glossinidius]